MAINLPQKFKPTENKLTEFRIKLAMKYLAFCHKQMLTDKKTYDYANRGKIKQEDFLRNGFVDDYLSKKENKEHYKNNISDNPSVEIYFQKEENQPYLANEELADDYIDISIKETKLSETMSTKTSDEIKFAIECKRINKVADYNEYIGDIQKFADRDYTTYRLPYEGQIAFIEDNKLTPPIVSNELNVRLKKSKTIKTLNFLNVLNLHDDFDGAYSSSHYRNHKDNNLFSIVHLLLDYSNIIVNT